MGEAKRGAMLGRKQADLVLQHAIVSSMAIVSELCCRTCTAPLSLETAEYCPACEPVREFFELPSRRKIV